MDTDGAAEENLLVCLIVCLLVVCLLLSTVALSGLL